MALRIIAPWRNVVAIQSGHHYWKLMGKHMITINNVQPLDATQLTDILKTEFPSYVNERLGSNLAVEFAHVSDFVNISFPEVIEGNAYTIIVSDDSLELSDHTSEGTYNAELLEEHLIAFLILKAS
ncbi:hypothetical protein [Pedobacter polaris]|nr:hypothetical protein [Pedobacter polaris]